MQWCVWGLWLWVCVVCVERGQVSATIFQSIFGRKGKGKGGVDLPRYSDIYPLYWKNTTCVPVEDSGKYLLMSKRNGGWNNERMIIENAIVMAWITGRTLVIPKELHFDHMHGRENFEKFLDLRWREREREREREKREGRETGRERRKRKFGNVRE